MKVLQKPISAWLGEFEQNKQCSCCTYEKLEQVVRVSDLREILQDYLQYIQKFKDVFDIDDCEGQLRRRFAVLFKDTRVVQSPSGVKP